MCVCVCVAVCVCCGCAWLPEAARGSAWLCVSLCGCGVGVVCGSVWPHASAKLIPTRPDLHTVVAGACQLCTLRLCGAGSVCNLGETDRKAEGSMAQNLASTVLGLLVDSRSSHGRWRSPSAKARPRMQGWGRGFKKGSYKVRDPSPSFMRRQLSVTLVSTFTRGDGRPGGR